MEPADVAKQLDAEFRSSCARLNSDEPWFGRFDLRVDGTLRPYKVGAKRLSDERIVDWRHPLARAYYDTEPGEEFELDQRGFAAVSGVVDSLATLTAQARTVRRVELRTERGKFELFAGELGFHAEAERPRARPPTKADGLPDVLSLLTPEQYRLITSQPRQSRDHPGTRGLGQDDGRAVPRVVADVRGRGSTRASHRSGQGADRDVQQGPQ